MHYCINRARTLVSNAVQMLGMADCKYYAVATMVTVVGGVHFLRKQKAEERRLARRKDYPRDVVVLHTVNRAPCSPSISPFCLKLETYLRMANIPYQCEFGFSPSSKGKVPWITYNDEDVADSQGCIEFLNRKFSVDLNQGLDNKDLAISHSFRIMMETELFFLFASTIWTADTVNKALAVALPEAGVTLRCLIRRHFEKLGKLNGYSSHSHEERVEMGKRDLKAIEDLIGDRKFMMGDRPSELDAVAFGFISMAMHHLFDSEYQRYILEDLPNLRRFIETMKTEYYSDWDTLIQGF